MNADLPARTSARMRALNVAGEYAELVAAGIPAHTVGALYPPTLAGLYLTLAKYIAEGKRFEFPSLGASYERRTEDRALQEMLQAQALERLAAELAGLLYAESHLIENLLGYANAMIGVGVQASKEERYEHVQEGLRRLARAFWYTLHSDEFRDRNRVSYHLLFTSAQVLPELGIYA